MKPKGKPSADNSDVLETASSDAKILHTSARFHRKFWDLIPVWLYSPLRYLFGRDVFISYSRRDAGDYATNLVLVLQKRARKQRRKLSFYLDKWIAPPDGELPKSLKRQLRWSSTLVVICTKFSVGSPFVKDEIKHFAELKRKIILVNVDDILSDAEIVNMAESPWKEIGGAFPTAEPESGGTLKNKRPSRNVIERILKSMEFTTQDQRLLRSVWATVGFILIFTGLGFAYNYWTIADARAQAAEANKQAAFANEKRQKAEEGVIQAQKKVEQAEEKERAANDRTEAANIRAGTAETKAAEQEKRALTASATAKKADAQRILAEGRTVEAQRKESAATERAQLTDEQERGSRASVVARQPGRQFEGLALAVSVANENFKRPARDDKVINGLTTSVIAADFALPLNLKREKIAFVQISPDGSLLFVESAYANSTDRKWEIFSLQGTKDPLLIFDHAPSLVRSVSFSRNNTHVAVTVDNQSDPKGKDGLQIWNLNDPGDPISFDLRNGLAALDDKGERVAMIETKPIEKLVSEREKLIIKKLKTDAGDEEEDEQEEEDQQETYPLEKGLSAGEIAFDRKGEIILKGIKWEEGQTSSSEYKFLRLSPPKWVELRMDFRGGDLAGVAEDNSLIITSFRSNGVYGLGTNDEVFQLDINDGHPKWRMSGFNGSAKSATLTNPPRTVVLNGGKLSLSDARVFGDSYVMRGLGQGLSEEPNEEPSIVAYSPQEQFMASTSRDSLNVWKSEGEKILPILESLGVFESIAFSKNNSRIAAFETRGSDVSIWDISTGKSATPVCRGDGKTKLPSPAAMTFLDDGKFVAVAFKGGMVVIWDAATCVPVKIAHLVVSQNSSSVFRDYNGYEPVNYTGLAVFSTTGPTLVTANTQYNYSTKKYEVREVHMWDLSQVDLGSKMAEKPDKINDSLLKNPIRLAPKHTLIQNLPGQLIAATFDNQLKLLVRNQNDGTLKVIGEAGQSLAELHGKNFDDAIIAAFSSDAQRIVTADRNNQEIKIWNANNGDLILNVSSFFYQFNKVAISANGETFAVGDNYGTVRIYPSTVEGFLDLASRLGSK